MTHERQRDEGNVKEPAEILLPAVVDNDPGFISDGNILACDSMGFVHALLPINITLCAPIRI